MQEGRRLTLEQAIEKEFLRSLRVFYQEKSVCISISKTELNPNLDFIKIYISIFPAGKRKKVFEKIEKVLHLVQTDLFKKIPLRKFPKVLIYLDETADTEERIISLIDQVKKDFEEDVEDAFFEE